MDLKGAYTPPSLRPEDTVWYALLVVNRRGPHPQFGVEAWCRFPLGPFSKFTDKTSSAAVFTLSSRLKNHG
jgi:hypothetical protein